MNWKYTIDQSIAHYFRKFLMFLFCWEIIILIFSFQPLYAQPISLDVEYNSISFLNSNRSVVVDRGNNGFSQGSMHRYNNLITKNGRTVYGLLTIQEIKNAIILNFDDDVTYGIPSRFQPEIRVSAKEGGYIVYKLQFFDAAANEDVFINNFYLTGIDVDGNNYSNREYIEYGDFSSYIVNDPNLLEISTSTITGRTRFLGRQSNLSGIGFDNTCSSIVNFTNSTNSIYFVLGQIGQNAERNYSLQFGAPEGFFSNPLISTNPILVAIDDIGMPLNSNTGGIAVNNVLNNDFINGLPVSPSLVTITQTVPASNPGVMLNTSTGAINVLPGIPAGNYSLGYKVCLVSNPTENCNSAKVLVKILTADLAISKSGYPDPIIAGQNFTYSLTVSNNGPSSALNVLVNDVVPTGISIISATPSAGSWNGTNWNIGKMADSTSVTMIIVAKIASNITGSILDSAIVSSSTYDPITLNNRISQIYNITTSANLSVKTESSQPAIAGQNITYKITVTNEGPSDALNVVVLDDLPYGLNLIGTDPSVGTWATPNWTIGNLKCGLSATLNVEAKINSNFSGIISNTATVSSSTNDVLLENNKFTQVATVNKLADLAVLFISNTDNIIAGEVINYTILVTNNGPSDSHLIQFCDYLPPEIQFVQFSIDNGATWNSWISSYSIESLNSGDSIKILILGSLSSNAEQGSVTSNTASITSSTPDINLSNNIVTKKVNVSCNSDMSVLLSGPSTIVAGTKIAYDLSVVNNGPSNSRSLIITDVLPAGISNAEFSMNNGNTWELWHGTFGIPLFNSLGMYNVLLRGDVNSGSSGSLVNTSSITSLTADKVNSNNSSTVTTSIVGESDLILSIVESISPLQKNGQVSYRISVLNSGPSDASNVMITDNFDQGNITDVIYNNGSSLVPWTGSLNIGNIKKDSTKTIDIWGTIANNASDPLENTVSAYASVADPFPFNNSQTIRNLLNIEADLSIIKMGPKSINAGEQIQYSITVTNHSTSMNAENVLVTDNLDNSKINYPEYSINGGLNWYNWVGRLNIGTINFNNSVTFIIRGNVYSNARGIIKNSVQVSSNTPDPFLGNNNSTISTLITSLSNVSVAKTIVTSPDNIIEGSNINYLLTFNNKGPSDAYDFFINDVPTVGLSNFEVSQNSSPYFSWNGSYNAGTFVAGKTGSLVIRGTISGDISGSISNTASVISNSIDPDLSDNSSQISTLVIKKADLMISIIGLSNPINVGDLISYTLSVKNNGPSNAQNVSVLNTISSAFQNTQFSINGGSSWNDWAGSFFLETLPSGSSFNILIKTNVKSELNNGIVVNISCSVGSSTNDPKLENNSFQTNTTILTVADLSIQKSVEYSLPSVGDLAKFTLKATNYGPSKALSVFVTDFLPSGFTYFSDNGNGAFNPLTGVWTIGDMLNLSSTQLEIIARVLSNGDYNNTAVINGLSTDPDLKNNVSIIEVKPDIEAIYTVAFPKNVDSYSNGQLLASVTDGDGNIVSAELSSGLLPLGTNLNSVSGKISVTDSTLLKAGDYLITVTTFDTKGGITIHHVEIKINPDSESIYNVSSAKNEDDYATGETLATISDTDGKIVYIELISGSLPSGTSFNYETGEITISNNTLLSVGIYTATILSIDDTGGRTIQPVTLEVNRDKESKYIVKPPKLIGNYFDSDTLAYVTDGDGIIVFAELTDGELPKGSVFDQITGVISVVNPDLLIAGSYWLFIKTIDNEGGKSGQLVKILIGSNIEPVYTIEPSQNIDTYRNGDTLAFIKYDIDEITSVSLLTGQLPPGTKLNQTTGEITISNTSSLVAGSYSATIKVNDVFSVPITIVLISDFESVYKVETSKNLFSYKNGDVLASVMDKDGSIVSATIQFGSLPSGVAINHFTGEIFVSDSSALVAAIYTFYVKTTDVSGGITSQSVTISFVATDLSITKSCTPEIVTAGEKLSYTLTVTNNGPNNALGVEVTDLLPVGLTFISSNPSIGSWISPIWELGKLAKGASAILVIEANVSSNLSGIISNCATVNSLTSDPVPGNNIAILNSTVSSKVNLIVTLTGNPDPVIAGENITYNMKVVNYGPSDAKNIVLTNDLPASLNFISASDGGKLTGGKVEWNMADLQTGGSHTFSMVVSTNSNLSEGSVITNKVEVKSDNSNGAVNSNIVETIIKTHSNLLIQKTTSSKVVQAGEIYTYTILATNKGPSDATNVRISDELPSSLTFVSASENGSFNNGVVTWYPGKLINGANFTCSLVVKVNVNVTNGTVISNKAIVNSNNSDNPVESDLENVLVKSYSNISIQKNASSEIIGAGENMIFTIIATNNGPSDATNVRITDELPSSLTFVSASDNGSFNNGLVTWSPGNLVNGANYSCSLVVMVNGNVSNGTIITNKAIVNSDTSEGSVESEPESVLVKAHAEFEIMKTASKEIVVSGEEVTYSININNAGTSDANNVTITDTLPLGLTFINASSGSEFSNGIVTWTETKLVGISEKTYSMTVRVNKNVLKGTVIRNVAYVESDNSDGKLQSIPADITIDAISDLVLTKNAISNVNSGESLVYSIQLTNNGPSDAMNITVSDIIPAGLIYSSSDGGTVSNGTVKWNIASLSVGSSQIFTLETNVDENITDGTQIINTASATCSYSTKQFESNTVSTKVVNPSVITIDDTGVPINGADGGITVENILANDLYNSTVVDISFVKISLVSSTSDKVSLNLQTGEVIVSPGTPAGSYDLVYRICLDDYPQVCDDASVHVTVLAPEILANDDKGDPINNEEGGVAVEDITDNDLLNGKPVNVTDVLISLVTQASVSGINLNSETGKVTVESGTTAGIYEMTYRICEKLNPANCDEADVTVTIQLTENCEILVPTGFSPNDDGIHDFFMIKCMENYPDAILEVYNRWGNLVYKKEKYGNVDQWGEAEAWWGGYSNRNLSLGKDKLPPGTYFYILKLNNGSDVPVTGSVFLNR